MKVVRSNIQVATLALIILLITAAAAFAENRAGAVTVSPFAGRFIFDHELDYDNSSLFGLALGYNLTQDLAAELSYARANTSRNNLGAEEDGTMDLYRLEGLYHLSKLSPCKSFVPFVAAGAGMWSLDSKHTSSGRDNDFIADYGLGLKYFLNPDVALRADVRHVLNFEGADEEYSSSMFYSFGLNLLFGGNKAAAAPAAAVAPAKKAEPAKPAPVVPPAAPAKKAPVDSDGDGVADANDKCPNTPAGVSVDKNGCPLDTDGDGVIDANDKCPGTPAKVAVDKAGCPIDSDGDGVADYLDKCAGTPKGTKVDANGCPVPVKAEVTKQGTYNFGIVYFDTSKAKIKPQSKKTLDGVIEYMKNNPEVKMEVQGYTDSRGAEDMNLKLSDARANAVRQYLINNGIAADRLTAKGYGESNPAASNNTKAGMAKNRRIEFKPF